MWDVGPTRSTRFYFNDLDAREGWRMYENCGGEGNNSGGGGSEDA